MLCVFLMRRETAGLIHGRTAYLRSHKHQATLGGNVKWELCGSFLVQAMNPGAVCSLAVREPQQQPSRTSSRPTLRQERQESCASMGPSGILHESAISLSL